MTLLSKIRMYFKRDPIPYHVNYPPPMPYRVFSKIIDNLNLKTAHIKNTEFVVVEYDERFRRNQFLVRYSGMRFYVVFNYSYGNWIDCYLIDTYKPERTTQFSVFNEDIVNVLEERMLDFCKVKTKWEY